MKLPPPTSPLFCAVILWDWLIVSAKVELRESSFSFFTKAAVSGAPETLV